MGTNRRYPVDELPRLPRFKSITEEDFERVREKINRLEAEMLFKPEHVEDLKRLDLVRQHLWGHRILCDDLPWLTRLFNDHGIR